MTGVLMILSPTMFRTMGWKGVAATTPQILLVGGVGFFGTCMLYQYAFANAVGGIPSAEGGFQMQGAFLWLKVGFKSRGDRRACLSLLLIGSIIHNRPDLLDIAGLMALLDQCHLPHASFPSSYPGRTCFRLRGAVLLFQDRQFFSL